MSVSRVLCGVQDVVNTHPPAPPSSSSSSGEAGVDPTRREAALSEERFKQTFGITKAEFYALPLWRQQQEKKKHGLF